MTPQRLVERMRSILVSNSSSGVFPSPGRYQFGSERTNVDQDEFPGVDCDEVCENLYLGNG